MPVASRKLAAKTPVKNTGSKKSSTAKASKTSAPLNVKAFAARQRETGFVFDLSQEVEPKDITTWANGNVSTPFKCLNGRTIILWDSYKKGLTIEDFIEDAPGRPGFAQVKKGIKVLADGGLIHPSSGN